MQYTAIKHNKFIHFLIKKKISSSCCFNMWQNLHFFSTTTTIYDKYWMILTNAIVFCDIMTWLGEGFGKILTKWSHSNKRSKEIQTIPLISYLFFLRRYLYCTMYHTLFDHYDDKFLYFVWRYYLIWPKKKMMVRFACFVTVCLSVKPGKTWFELRFAHAKKRHWWKIVKKK